VLIALRERLARERNTEERIQERIAAITAIGRDVAERLGPEWQRDGRRRVALRRERAAALIVDTSALVAILGSGHPARLNFGDCLSYALASVSGQPLLYKGDDFGHTDVVSAI
jgi:hypothetical protein